MKHVASCIPYNEISRMSFTCTNFGHANSCQIESISLNISNHWDRVPAMLKHELFSMSFQTNPVVFVFLGTMLE